jgi:hypothetical protein
MPLLPDGSEKGLKGNFKEDFSHRTRIGLAPRAGHIDRSAPYKRIATEEAWTFPALVKAQVDYLESGDAPADDSLKMAGMFSRMPSLQEMLQDLGELRLSHMDEYGIDRQLLLLTAPGVQVVRPRRTTSLPRPAATIRTAFPPAPPSTPATCKARSGKSSERSARSSSTARCSIRISRGTISTRRIISRSSRR